GGLGGAALGRRGARRCLAGRRRRLAGGLLLRRGRGLLGRGLLLGGGGRALGGGLGRLGWHRWGPPLGPEGGESYCGTRKPAILFRGDRQGAAMRVSCRALSSRDRCAWGRRPLRPRRPRPRGAW